MSVELNFADEYGIEDPTSALASLGGLDAMALPQLPTTYDWQQQDIPAGKIAGARIELFTFQAGQLPGMKTRLDAAFPSALANVGFGLTGPSQTTTTTITAKWSEVTNTIAHNPPLAAGDRHWDLVVTSGPKRVLGYSLGSILANGANPIANPTQAALAGSKLLGVYTAFAKPTSGTFDYAKATGLSQAVNTVYRAYNAANAGATISLKMISVLPVGSAQVASVGGGGPWWLLLLAGAAVVATSGGKGVAAAKAAPFVAKGALLGAKKAGAMFAAKGY